MRISAGILTTVFVALGTASIPSAAWAAPPTSRGELYLPVSLQECIARANRALPTEGFTGSRYNGGGFEGGSKGIHSAVITCNVTVANQVVVNVFVASEGVTDNRVPDYERMRLQERMNEGAGGGARVAVATGCDWPDGQDPRFRADPGGGVLNARAHYDYVASGNRASVPQAVANRFEAARGCLSSDAFAKLYSDAAVLIAAAGRRSAGWRDGPDPSAPPNDMGRGTSDGQAHYRYARGNGASQVPTSIGERMRVLNAALSRDAYAQLYGELSVLIARHAAGR